MRAAVFLCPESIAAAWSALRPARDFHHAAGRCPSSAARALRCPVGATCEPCRDLLVDALAHAHRVFGGADQPPALVYRTTRNWLTDHLRAENARRAGVARPDRVDGVVGRIRAAVATGPEPRWRDELLTLLLATATARGPVPATGHPYEVLAQAKAAHTGRPVGTSELRREVADLTTVVERIAGTGWVDENLLAPLRFRHAEYGTARIGAAYAGEESVTVVDPEATAPTDPDRTRLEDRFWAELRTGGRAEDALRRAALGFGGATADLPPPLLRAVARQYVAQLSCLGRDHPPETAEQVRTAVAARAGERAADALPASFVRSVVTRLAAVERLGDAA